VFTILRPDVSMVRSSPPWTCLRLVALPLVLAALLLTPASARAQWPAGQVVPDLAFDRVDTNAVWRLSQVVPVADRPSSAALPSALYVQFGFLGCAPCEVLAQVANEVFGDRVVRVYVHLDDVVLQPGERPQELWRRLYEATRQPPYASFLTMRRGSSEQMHQICGADANPPSGLLIRPDGTLVEVVRTPDPTAARAIFQRFVQGL
jgi:hypothetical protein